MQERKQIKFVNKFAENFKLHAPIIRAHINKGADDLPQNSDIHHTDLTFDKRNAALWFYWNSKDDNTNIIT